MVNASVICTNKTGMLTQNVMNVVAGLISIHAKFVCNLKENKARTNAPIWIRISPERRTSPRPPPTNVKHADDFSIEHGNITAILSPQLKRLFNQSITINCTALTAAAAQLI